MQIAAYAQSNLSVSRQVTTMTDACGFGAPAGETAWGASWIWAWIGSLPPGAEAG